MRTDPLHDPCVVSVETFNMVHTSSWMMLLTFLVVAAVYLGTLVLYRLFLHPLRKFPGTLLAALTNWHWDFHASEIDYLKNLHARYGQDSAELTSS